MASSRSSPSPPLLDRIDGLLRSLLAGLATALLAVMVVVCVAQVLLRNLAAGSLGWYDELAGYLLVWLTFLAAALAQQRQEHISVHALQKRLRPGPAKALRLLVQVLLFAMQLALVYYGAVLALGTPGRAVTLPLPMGLVYAVVPISAAGLAAIHLIQMIRLCRKGE